MSQDSEQENAKMEDFTPRSYQVELMEIGLKRNTIIYLPTGTGKTFIALMILKSMSGDLIPSYSKGGKLSIILVNTIALVDQHAKYIENHTNLKVGQYSGDMKLDYWPRDKWYEEYDKNQVLVMTCQILYNNVVSNHIDLNKVNLLIFDECHRGVSDHSMRQIMKAFQDISDPPRVIGLTATLLNGNCKPNKVLEQVDALEVTYHSKVATVDGLSEVIGYATNPREYFKICMPYSPNEIELMALAILNKVISIVSTVRVESEQPTFGLAGHFPLGDKASLKKLKNLIQGVIDHIKTMGTFGGLQTAIAYAIQIERLKRTCLDENLLCLLNYVQTSLTFIKQLLENIVLQYPEEEQAFKCSSEKVMRLIEIFDEYKERSKEELCGIVFTQQRFTAKIIYFILDKLSKSNPKYSYIKPDYMVGFNNNPYNSTRAEMYSLKKNRQVLKSFESRDINLIIASNVLEEGVDIPKCSLVIKYDKPLDYRSYIQSKGRARHKESLYYMIVESNDQSNFITRYREYQQVEQILNDYLMGNNEMRNDPSEEEIQKMYNEHELLPYYAAGPGSAQVNMTTAIPLLCQYCSSLPSDIYTQYSPEWYLKKETRFVNGISFKSVSILLPTTCPITDYITGDYMPNVKTAKRAAALKACIQLHQIGELDDHLLPKKQIILEEDINFLFTHYPAIKEPFAGTSRNKRLHKIHVSKHLRGSITPNTYYLHIVHFKPVFSRSSDINDSAMYDCYTSDCCFGMLTLNPLPPLCTFPIFVTLGTLNVEVKVNQNKVVLNENNLRLIRKFHHTIFKEILKITSLSYLVLDNSDTAEVLLVVPVNKTTRTIDMNILKELQIKEIVQLSAEEKLQLEVTQEDFLNKVVCPWHRDTVPYIVTEVCLNKSSFSPFPNEDYSNYVEYFKIKYNQNLTNPRLPLLLVRGLTKRLNFIKPAGAESKRKRDKIFEETTEHLPPELVVKQDFPTSLWIQARFLPNILSRVSFMLRIEELRVTIAKETGLGQTIMREQPPLMLDEYLLNYKPYFKESESTEEEHLQDLLSEPDLNAPPTVLQINKDFAAKQLEAEFPWKDIEEPKDIERTLEVSIMDIEYFERFMNEPIDSKKALLRNESPIKKQLALTYDKDFVPKHIRLLEERFLKDGPSISGLYKALTAAKGNDIVNLERLETLGDTFLKLISSCYVYMRFPKYAEGKHTMLKGRLVSNKNLYYLAERKNIQGIMKYNEMLPKDEWLPPAYTVPKEMLKRIEGNELSIRTLFDLNVSFEEQLSGCLETETVSNILEMCDPPEKNECNSYHSMACFLKSQYIGDKHVADVVESLLGCYFLSCGFTGGIKFIEWMGIIPKSEQLETLLKSLPPNPVLKAKTTKQEILKHLPQWQDIENIIGYNFKNHAYMLQAFTHSSYSLNRITLSYEKLEFLGDAILDFLITCYIYEACGNLNPGQLTDLRSALVNNNTFAGLVVRSGLHKHFLMLNYLLQTYIDRFDNFMKGKNYVIDDEVLILLEEGELHLAEYVDVPKALGDLFEAIIGAIYLDCGKDLNIVWNVIYKIMWKEIDLFSRNVPINVIRRLFETPDIEPKFGKTAPTVDNKYIVPLQFLMNGTPTVVHGCGANKLMAKRAAAKLALRTLEV